jgi:hypothetical protein
MFAELYRLRISINRDVAHGKQGHS